MMAMKAIDVIICVDDLRPINRINEAVCNAKIAKMLRHPFSAFLVSLKIENQYGYHCEAPDNKCLKIYPLSQAERNLDTIVHGGAGLR